MIKRILQWTKECVCNSGKPNFDAIEFGANSSKIVVWYGRKMPWYDLLVAY